MSLEAALKAFIAEVVREISVNAPAAPAAPAAKRGPGRPAKNEEAGSPPAPAAGPQPSVGNTAPQPPAAAAPAAAALTHTAVAPSFLAAAKAHGRDFVISVMKDLGVPGDPPTFDKVPAALLAQAKAALEAGPKAKPAASDGTDLLG